MKRRLLLGFKGLMGVSIAVWLVFMWISIAPSRAHESPPVEKGKNFLWSLQSEKNTVYFLGSMHVLTRGAYPLAKEIENAYGDSQKLVFETDLDAMNDPALQAEMVGLGLYPETQSLEQDISKETYKLFMERIADADLPLAQFVRFRPWLCALTLSVLELERLGFDQSYGIDTYFFNRAKRDRKGIAFFEPAENHLKFFTEMAKEEQESFLRQTLEDLRLVQGMSADMVNYWEKGDVDGLSSILKKSFQGYPEIFNYFVTERNRQWIPKIVSLLGESENVLVIVGAAHLIGKDSLLGILQERGYQTRQR